MREEDSKWEEELPSPEELIPLSQTLISPDLAMAFDLRSYNHRNNGNSSQTLPQTTPTQAEFAGDEPARTLKRPRLVWTPQLHKRFVDAVAHLGIKNAVPKTIMQLMSVEGLTRENVASHLQKYRLYLKRMQSGGGRGNVGESDHLFASSPVPTHFLHPTGRQSSDHFIPSFVSLATSQYASSLFLARQRQQQPVLIRPSSLHMHSQVANYAEDVGAGAKTVLTLFPTRED